MLSSCAAALKLSCSATARKVRSWCRVSPFSTPRVSAMARTTIGQVTESGDGERKPRRLSPVRPTTSRPAGPPQAPDLRPPTASEQKLNQFRKRRYDVLHGETDAIRKRRGQGKPDARKRIDALLDPGSFVELDMFAAARAHDMGMKDRTAGDGVVVGFGTIEGRDVALYAFDPTVLGGSLGEVTAEKI